MERVFLAELKLPKWIVFGLALVAVVLLGALDFVTGCEFGLSFFFVFPIAFVGWHAGSRWGWTLAAAAALTGVFASRAAGIVRSSVGHDLREAAVTFVVLAAIAYLFASLKAALERESASARIDPLTGAVTPRHFMEVLGAEISRAHRYGNGFALAYLDLDGFKQVNDTYGHAAGDDVLRWIGATFRGSLRETDLLARMGGDEFALLLPETDLADAEATLRKLHAAVRDHARALPFAVGFSAGVVAGPPPRADAETILGFADQLMYEAKASGKGRLCAQAFSPSQRAAAGGIA